MFWHETKKKQCIASKGAPLLDKHFHSIIDTSFYLSQSMQQLVVIYLSYSHISYIINITKEASDNSKLENPTKCSELLLIFLLLRAKGSSMRLLWLSTLIIFEGWRGLRKRFKADYWQRSSSGSIFSHVNNCRLKRLGRGDSISYGKFLNWSNHRI